MEHIRDCIVFCALAASVVAFFVAATGGAIARAWRSATPGARAVAVLAIVAATLYGGSKGRIYFPYTDPETRYLTDAGSYVTNDHVRVNFTRSILVPVTANLFVDRCETCWTNDAEITAHTEGFYSNTFAGVSLPMNLACAAATNWNWYVYTDWTPPPVVHTNGVAYVVWQIGSTTNRLATTRTGVYEGRVKLAPNPAITNGPAALLLSVENTQLNTTETP